MKVRAALEAAAGEFAAAGIETARLDAEVLLSDVLALSRAFLVAHREDELASSDAASFDELVRRRVTREPVSQLLGRREFRSCSFAVTPDVLTPRPETEMLVDLAADAIARGARRVVDVGTGSGAIPIALALECAHVSGLELLAVDLSAAALAVAHRNRASLLGGESGRVRLAQADLLTGLRQGWPDLVVSNPPYLSVEELRAAPAELAFEPEMALVGGEDDGLGVIRKLVVQARRTLCPGGELLVEIGETQGAAVAGLASAAGFRDVRILPDLAGCDRVLRAQ